MVFPANEEARIQRVKSFTVGIDNLHSLSDAEKLLREAERKFSRQEATDFVSVVKKIAQREAGSGRDQRQLAEVLNRAAQMMSG